MTNQLEAPSHLWSSAVDCALISFPSAPLSSDSRTAALIYLTEWEALNRIGRKTMEMKDEPWGGRLEQQGGDDEKGEKAEEERTEGVTARQRRIKKEAALQLERRVQRTLRSVWQVTDPLMSLQKVKRPLWHSAFLLNWVPELLGFYAKKNGCQLIDDSVASSITWISSSLPLHAQVTAFHPETADKCKPVHSVFFLLCLCFSHKASKKKNI